MQHINAQRQRYRLLAYLTQPFYMLITLLLVRLPNNLNNILIGDGIPDENKMRNIVALREMTVHFLATSKRFVILSARNLMLALIRLLPLNIQNLAKPVASNPDLTPEEQQKADLMQEFASILGLATSVNLNQIKRSYEKIQSLRRDNINLDESLEYELEMQSIQDRIGEALGFLAAIAYLYNQNITLEELESLRATYVMAIGYTMGNIASRNITHLYKLYSGVDLAYMQEPLPGTLTDELKVAASRALFFELRQ